MILIPQKLIIEECLGLNMASFMSKMTKKVSRRTIADDLKGKPTMAEKSRKIMMDDIKGFFSEKICPELSSEKLDDFGLFPDRNDEAVVEEVYKHRRSYYLSSLEKGLMLGQGSLKTYEEGGRILPPESIKELQVLEEASHAISESFRSNGWEAAKATMLAGRDKNPLLYTGMFQHTSLGGIDSWVKLKQYCSVFAIDHLMYMLALVDLAVSHNGDITTAESLFEDLLPVWKDEAWSFPIKAWIDGVKDELGLKGINDMGRAVARWQKMDDTVGIRKLKNWRSGKIPDWDMAIVICDKLDDECDLDDVWWKHLCRYGAARTLQSFHSHYMKNHVVEGNPLALKPFYDEYSNWYRHHQALNSKAPA